VELVPSVVVMITNFCIDWPAGEWIRRESNAMEILSKLRNAVTPRDVKVILVAIKTGAGIIDRDVIEERTNSMKKHFQLDGKNFMVMTVADLNPLSPIIRRLSKTIHEFSSAYYSNQSRRLKNIERMVRPSDFILISRFNFKVAFFYEFQGQASRALRHYKQCYVALIDTMDHCEDEMLDQVKAVAEMVNFKICSNMLLTGVAKDASAQFRSHISHFSSAYSGRPWRHYAWIAEQYIIYADMLTRYNINSSFTDADKTYYYHNAALFSLKRQSSFATTKRTSRLEDSFEKLSQNFHGMNLIPPHYFGGSPQLIDPVLDQVQRMTEDVRRLVRQYLIDKESEINHTEIILSLLRKALENVNPIHRRRRAHLRVLISKQLMNMGQYDLASANLNPAIEFLGREKWAYCAIPVLRKKMSCSIYLGRPKEYVPAALMLYSIAASNYLSKHDREELHRDVISIITNTEKPTEDYLRTLRRENTTPSSSAASRRASYLPPSSLGLPLRPEYGIAAVDGHPPEYFLPDGYVIDLMDTASGLFDIKVQFQKKTIEVGHYVQTCITVTSLFQGTLIFSEMSAHFTEDLIIQTFYQNDESTDSSSTQQEEEEQEEKGKEEKTKQHKKHNSAYVRTRNRADSSSSVIPEGYNLSDACLVFKSKQPNQFTFDMFIPESCLANANDVYVCLEKLVLTMRVDLPVQTSGEKVSLEEDISFVVSTLPETTPQCLEEDLGIDAHSMNNSSSEQEQQSSSMDQHHLPGTTEEMMISSSATMAAGDDDRLGLDDNNLDEVGDFLSAEPLTPVKTTPMSINLQSSVSQDETTDVIASYRNKLERTEDSDDDEEQEHEEGDFLASAHCSVERFDSDSNLKLPSDTPEESADRDVPEIEESNPPVQDTDDMAPLEVKTSDISLEIPSAIPDEGTPTSPKESVEEEIDESFHVTMAAEPLMMSEYEGGDDSRSSFAADVGSSFPPQGSVADSVNEEVSQSAAAEEEEKEEKERVVSVSTPPPVCLRQTSEIQGMKDRGYREVIFELAATTRAFREARQQTSKNGNLRETATFLGADGPKTLHISRPKSRLTLLHPLVETVSILQGTIQRINFVFHCGQDKIVNGKIFLSSNYHEHPHSNGDFFWYPDLNPSESCDAPIERVDNVLFHPLTINETTMQQQQQQQHQPLSPFLIPYQNVESVFCCPVFIKSDVQGEVTMKLRVEYIPKGFMKTAVSKEFSLKVLVLKPFGMNFNITSIHDTHCGIEKKHNSSVFLRGEMINVSASLDCVNSLGNDLEITTMSLTTKSFRHEATSPPTAPDTVTAGVAPNAFEIINSPSNGNLLACGITHLPTLNFPHSSNLQAYVNNTSTGKVIALHKGEAYVGSCDMRCLEIPQAKMTSSLSLKNMRTGSSYSLSSTKATVGEITVNWRIKDRTLLSPFDLSPFLKAIHPDSDCDQGQFVSSWLLPLHDPSSPSSSSSLSSDQFQKVQSVNKNVTRTRTCSMVFTIQEVQVSLTLPLPSPARDNSPLLCCPDRRCSLLCPNRIA
jgi:hypothetical protein